MDNMFTEYLEIVETEHAMRREIQDRVMNDPIGAMKAGLIKVSFGFPTPNVMYRKEIIDRINNKL